MVGSMRRLPCVADVSARDASTTPCVVCRYINSGRRIDYWIVDAAVFAHALAGPPLTEDESDEGAARAATAGGKWMAAPTHGVLMGLQEARQSWVLMGTHGAPIMGTHGAPGGAPIDA